MLDTPGDDKIRVTICPENNYLFICNLRRTEARGGRRLKLPQQEIVIAPIAWSVIIKNNFSESKEDFGLQKGKGMPTLIKILVAKITLRAELFDTPCAKKIAEKLPMEAHPNEWGDEFYFEIPVEDKLDDTATTKVKIGDIGYWPPGKALALFFGPTPMSTGDEPVPAGEVNIVGKIIDDATILRQAKGASRIKLEKSA